MLSRKACMKCKSINTSDTDECNQCGNDSFSDNYSGILVVCNSEESDVADEIGITEAGTYALKIR
jgi:DNA-directed RNA polymerase subunit E"